MVSVVQVPAAQELRALHRAGFQEQRADPVQGGDDLGAEPARRRPLG